MYPLNVVSDDIKSKLISKGIPESEIAYIHDAKTGKQKSELFDNIYMYFKSNQYCWQVNRSFEDKELEKEYREWTTKNSEKLWWKHASGRDFD